MRRWFGGEQERRSIGLINDDTVGWLNCPLGSAMDDDMEPDEEHGEMKRKEEGEEDGMRGTSGI